MDREAWRAAVHGITKSRTRLEYTHMSYKPLFNMEETGVQRENSYAEKPFDRQPGRREAERMLGWGAHSGLRFCHKGSR